MAARVDSTDHKYLAIVDVHNGWMISVYFGFSKFMCSESAQITIQLYHNAAKALHIEGKEH